MNWLKRLFGPADALAGNAGALDGALRAGYDHESRGELAEAERLYRQVLEAEPENAEALYFLGRIAQRDRRDEEALHLFQRAAELRPSDATIALVLGGSLMRQRRFAEAAQAWRRGLESSPDHAYMRSDYAAALIELGRREEARVELEKLQELLPEVPSVHFNLGGILVEYGRIPEAIAAYRRVLQLDPHNAAAYSNLLLTLNYGDRYSASDVFAEHRRFGERFAVPYSPPTVDKSWPRRLRVGYVSPDFRAHVLAYFMEPILANHDHARFEVFCYHTHRGKDAVTDQLRAMVAHWRDCEDWSDEELAENVRKDRIDILVDLAGHTQGNGLLAFAMKPAPVQASYLGYPNTTGLAAVDYRISDAFADPPGESDRISTERLMRLPGSYFCYRPEPAAAALSPLPALSRGCVTFGCFNNFSKVSGAFLDLVSRLLSMLPDTRFLMKSRPLGFPVVADAVRQRFERAGIDPARIELRGWEASTKSHLEAYAGIDIALDTFPYNGATTTCEAIWMGVPVVNLAGDRHVGRMGSSLLNVVGLGELVAKDESEFIAICARLISNLQDLSALRGSLRQRMRDSPLLNEAAFVRELERCYVEMWECRIINAADTPPQLDGQSAAALLSEAEKQRASGKWAEVQGICGRLLAGHSTHLGALTLLWNASFDAGTPQVAAEPLVRAIAADPSVAHFHYMLGCVLQAQAKEREAIASFRSALALDPSLAKAQNNLGCLLEASGDLDIAMQAYRSAVEIEPALAQAHYNLGNLAKRLGNLAQAIEHIERALELEPRRADWRANLGRLFLAQGKLEEAVANARTAVDLDPDEYHGYASLGSGMLALGRVEEAEAAFRRAVALNPSDAAIHSGLLALLHYRHGNEPQAMFDEHLAWAERHARAVLQTSRQAHKDAARETRLNVGYVSPDLRRHSEALFIEPVLAAHDRKRLKVFFYVSNAEGEDAQGVHGLCEHWRDISGLSDLAAAERIRADGIDVLVDLAGHSARGRPLLFARKPAPVQVAWLGYPDTSGLRAMNYRLTDAIADPEGESDRFYTETLVRLARGFLCFSAPAGSPEVASLPAADSGHITFGGYHGIASVTPQMIELWSILLKAIPDARMRITGPGLSSEPGRRELRDRFAACGVGDERLAIEPPALLFRSYLENYGKVDIALDAFPCNAIATTCEALWMGVPVVTLAGRTHVSRVGASILSRVGLQELVANAADEYVEKAIALARDSQKVDGLRRGMRERIRASTLLDPAGFAAELEAAYFDMFARS